MAIHRMVSECEDVAHVPDGLAFDSEGFLYISCYDDNRIWRVSPKGKKSLLADDPTSTVINRATNIAFGGAGRKTLYIANLGGWHISMIRMQTPGQALAGTSKKPINEPNQRLNSLGVRVALLDMNAAKLDKASETLGNSALGLVADVGNQQAVEQAIATIMAQTGRIDILINSAGITGQTNLKSHEVDPADFDRVMRVNVNGCLNTSRAVLPHMLSQGFGRILHFASIAGKEGNAGMLAYSTSKAAVIGMTKVQGKEYAGTGITVNAIAPAVIFTELVAAMPQEQVKYMTDKIPMKRCGTKDEVVAMVEFIVSPEASFTTGFTFDLTGGRATY